MIFMSDTTLKFATYSCFEVPAYTGATFAVNSSPT